jgi:hypothetical protein
MAGKIKSFFIALGLIIICYLFLEEPIKFSLHSHSTNAHLTTFQKILPILISFILVAISIVYRNYMVEISNNRHPLNDFEKSKFVLMTCVLFHFVFYLIIPTIFFTV